MARFIGTIAAAVFVFGLVSAGRAADAKDANAILDKAIKALGGEEKLSKIKAATWNTKGTITFGGNDNEVTNHVIVQGLDHSRQITRRLLLAEPPEVTPRSPSQITARVK